MGEGASDERVRLNVAFRRHDRLWQSNLYVYPVISRRSRGVSIGLNLNPDKACNFDCVYCQVDRTVPPAVRKVDLVVLERELTTLLELAASGALFESAPFDLLPPDRRLRHATSRSPATASRRRIRSSRRRSRSPRGRDGPSAWPTRSSS